MLGVMARHSDRSSVARRSQAHASPLWLLLVLSLGAAGGMAAARYLARKDRLQPEDPDAPLFI